MSVVTPSPSRRGAADVGVLEELNISWVGALDAMRAGALGRTWVPEVLLGKGVELKEVAVVKKLSFPFRFQRVCV